LPDPKSLPESQTERSQPERSQPESLESKGNNLQGNNPQEVDLEGVKPDDSGDEPDEDWDPADDVPEDPAWFIDAFEFVRLGKTQQGSAPLIVLGRLVYDLPKQDPTALVEWTVRADRGPLGEQLLRLHVQTDLTVRCERCLGSFVLPIVSDVALQLVESEEELDDPDSFDPEDIDAIDAEFEKVLGDRKFDLLDQVEDELILCVPYVPKHDVCPPSSVDDAAAQMLADDNVPDKRPSPFAALANLKSKG
jgi:uncharacterized protein